MVFLVFIVVRNADFAASGVEVENIMRGHVMKLWGREMRPSASSQMTSSFAVKTYFGKLRIVGGISMMDQ